MLSKDEESKLDCFIEIVASSKLAGKMPLLGAYDIEWLATKLKETNDELAKVHEELYKVNKDYAKLVERYEG